MKKDKGKFRRVNKCKATKIKADRMHEEQTLIHPRRGKKILFSGGGMVFR
jgi:hypothetical protein